MNETKYTKQLLEVLDNAQNLAIAERDGFVGSMHMLAGMALCQDSVAQAVLEKHGIELSDIMNVLSPKKEKNVGKGKKKKLNFSPRALDLMEEAKRACEVFHEEKVGTEHLMIAMIKDPGCQARKFFDATGKDVRKILMDLVYSMGENIQDYKEYFQETEGGQSPTPLLEKFGRDLTVMAEQKQLRKVIGREDQLQRLVQVLARMTKNNPCLVGDAGVGKTAIAEGLAMRLAKGDVPKQIQGKRLISIELSSIVAGTKFRGEFEDRMQKIINEAERAGNVILFIDELHTIIGAGSAEGTLDASNILKPALARGSIQVLGATTLDEYRKRIEKDPALERRFQPVEVPEPSREETLEILEGIVSGYEKHHRVVITEDALEAAVSLSDRYIHDRFLPDKAIDLMDEAAAKASMSETGQASKEEKLVIQLEDLTGRLEDAMKNEDIEGALALKKKIEQVDKKYSKLLEKGEEGEEKIETTITSLDIAKLVSEWTKIPVDQVSSEESKRLLHLEDSLKKRVVGQDEAIKAISKAIRRGRAGIQDPKRPIGSFLFLGPTGVGKTELSKALAAEVFGSEDAMIRVDMSEYMESHSVAKMIGSPPGYVGYDEGGQLSEKIRRHPYSVVLFDEVEKAHPDVFNLLLQVFDDGILTDAHGKKVSFKNTILIMTSNIGASQIVDNKQLGFAAKQDEERDYENMRGRVMDSLKQAFRPEFLNRIDEILVFHQLNPENMKEIVKIMVESLEKRLQETIHIDLTITPAARNYLAEKGFDKKYGARPLKRTIQTELEDPMAEAVLDGRIKEGDRVTISLSQKTINISSKSQ